MNLNKIVTILLVGASLSAGSIIGTELIAAIRERKPLSIIKEIIDSGVPIDEQDREGHSPLVIALDITDDLNYSDEVVELLLSRKVNTDDSSLPSLPYPSSKKPHLREERLRSIQLRLPQRRLAALSESMHPAPLDLVKLTAGYVGSGSEISPSEPKSLGNWRTADNKFNELLLHDDNSLTLVTPKRRINLGNPLLIQGSLLDGDVDQYRSDLYILKGPKGPIAYSLASLNTTPPHAVIYRHHLPSGKRLNKVTIIHPIPKLDKGLDPKHGIPKRIQDQFFQSLTRDLN